jgi:peptide/nickel transport system substrate-binding protein
VVGLDEEVPTLDPAMHRSRTVEAVLRNLFDGLVTRDAHMNIVPELAESWRAVTPTVWEFRLRPGVRFHDGSPLTAEDAAFTIRRTIRPGAIGGQSSPRKGLLGSVTGAEARGELVLRITTDEPYPILPKMLTFHEVVPQAYIKRVGDEEFARRPVGTGPFRFVQHVKGERIVLERFDDYYGGSPDIPPVGPARLSRLVFLPIPEVATRLGALLAGEIDIAEKVPPHATELLERTEGVRLSACTGTRTYFLGMNCRRAPFNQLVVRQAFAVGLDLERLVDRILGGTATVLAGPLVPAAFGFDPDLPRRRFDPQAARRLLQSAGLDPATETELDCVDSDRELAEAAAGQLSELGVRVRPRVWKWDVLQPMLAAGERDLFLSSWGNASLDPADILLPLLQTGARGNYMGYSNREVDRALERTQTEFDPRRRAELFVRVQRIVDTDVPAVFGWAPQEIYGVRDRVRNWEARPDAMLMMHRAYLATPGAAPPGEGSG